MFIYEIKNKINNKRYIGATTQQPKYRKRSHFSKLNNNKHPNEYLQNAYNKYGKDNFEFNIIDSANTINELDILEEKYIKRMGNYNLRIGGYKNFISPTKGKKFKRTRNQRINLCKRNYDLVLISPNNEEYIIETVNLMCDDFKNLRPTGIKKLVNGKIDYYKGWTRKGTTYISKGHTISKSLRPNGYPNVISPNGELYNIDVLVKFCEKHNLHVGCMRNLINGKQKQHNGWQLT